MARKKIIQKSKGKARGRHPPSLLRISLLWLGSFQLRGGAAAGGEGWELGAVTSWCQNLHCGGPGKTWCFCGAQRRGNQVFLRRAAPGKIMCFCGAQRREKSGVFAARSAGEKNQVFLRRAAPGNDVFLRRAAPDFHYFCNLLPKGVTFLVDRPCPGCHPEAWHFFF